MSDPVPLRAIYQPFAPCGSDAALMRAVLLFDQVVVIDTVAPPYGERVPRALLDSGAVARFDPGRLVEDHDRLLAAAFKADLLDDATWRLFVAAPRTPDTMSLTPESVPPSAFGFLNSQPLGRINYGTDMARAARSDPTASLFAHDDIGNHFMRFLFHDGRAATLPGFLGRFAATDESSCVFPFTHAAALQVNLAMLVAAELDGTLWWDSPLQSDMLRLKRRRIGPEAGATVDVPSPAPALGGDPLDVERTLRYREALQETLGPWKEALRRSASHGAAELQAEAARATSRAAPIHQELFGRAADPSPLTGQLSVGMSPPDLLGARSASPANGFLTLVEMG
jgi:hypothetical protein